MKFPKLKHTAWCMIILCSPMVMMLVCMLAWPAVMDILPSGWSDAIGVAGFLCIGAAALIYLFKNLLFLIVSDGFLAVVRAWKNARMYYETDRNGKDRKTAKDKILRRMKKCGKKNEVCISEITPIAVSRSCRYCATIHYRAIEKISMLYSVSKLDEKTYHTIINSVKRNIQKTHSEPKHTVFEDKEQKNAPVACSAAVIILADGIETEMPELVMRKQSSPFGEMLVCVGDISTQRYYFDAVCEPYVVGLIGKPEKNIAFDMVKKLVFGGKLPLKGNENYVLTTEEHKNAQKISETVLWDYLREMRNEIRTSQIEEKKIIKSLENNEVRLIDDEIYCKYQDKVTSRPVETDESDSEKLTVCRFDQWVYPKKRTMSKKDMAEVEKLMNDYLLSEGYTVGFKDFEEFYEEENKGE